MIFDHRTYTCHPGRIKNHMKMYEEHGWATQSRHLGQPAVYGAVETGDVNSYVHIWVYRDVADRAAKRAALAADPEWHKFMKMSAESGNLARQVNTILTAAPFFEYPNEIG
ncbi:MULTISPECIES: NIPSNAP family protein [unclassified Marinovum]